MRKKTYILGAGVTGLAAGMASGLPILERQSVPGGICSSYYVTPGRLPRSTPPEDASAYRFEVGGGHWIFGGDPAVLRLIRTLTPLRTYQRRAAVFFARDRLLVPYPLQHHLGMLDQGTAQRALAEIIKAPHNPCRTMAEQLEQDFGGTLLEVFFGPFHERYTAGLWKSIAPQDQYKSPVNLALVRQGISRPTTPVGYNVTFRYPVDGLNALAQQMASRCTVDYGAQVVRLDSKLRRLTLRDGTEVDYERLISTLPLNVMCDLTGLDVGEDEDPCTSVLVLNIGGERGPHLPDTHWLYIPDSAAGFYRVGAYSNVDASFLPASERGAPAKTSLYVERAFRYGARPDPAALGAYVDAVLGELREWGFIGDVDVVDPTWIDVAYTWSRPGSTWRPAALHRLEQDDIFQAGRYGRWVFQGIADSIGEGLLAGNAARLTAG